jgi:hypothetical protein
MTATFATPQHKSFTRVVSHKYFMDLVKEARRVKYIIKQEGQHLYDVRDDETGDKVFFGMKHSSGQWVASFSTAYWVEPSFPA